MVGLFFANVNFGRSGYNVKLSVDVYDVRLLLSEIKKERTFHTIF